MAVLAGKEKSTACSAVQCLPVVVVDEIPFFLW
jgi:hypothetical protein